MKKSKLSRRRFMQTTALGTLAAGGAVYLGAGALTTREGIAKIHSPTALKIPPLQTGRDESGTQVYDLTLQNSSTEFFKGIKTKTSGISGSYLGPTLKMRAGNKVRINVTNELGELSTLHWHGMHLPASQDGGPHQLVKSGETWSPEFEIKQKAASLWYHPHHIGKTAEHVWRGMAGMLIVEDDEADSFGLPNKYGVDDIPLVLQDRTFSSDGAMDYSPSMPSIMMGMIGNTPLANGTLSAFFEAKSKLLRLRILNGSNASFYNLGFADNKPFKQIATDGGLLEAPVELTRLVLAPGERAEIIVEMNNSETAVFRNYKWTATTTGGTNGMGGMMGGGMMGGMMGGTTPEFAFVTIRAAAKLANSPPLPANLAKIDWRKETDATVTRKFDFQMNMGPRVMVGLVDSHVINGKAMKMSRIDETVKLDTTEIWEISNSSFMAHPFHVHDVQFHILDRNGKQPPQNERGRKDTVLVNPGETVRIIMKFEDYADPNSPFMYHCHILEHEDAGMMGQFVVV